MLATSAPIAQYFDLDGSPLDRGEVYFGLNNQNPETAPQTVYWDAAGTQPAAQPIKTMNGYTVRGGSIAPVYVAADYSVTVRNKRGKLVLFAASSGDFSNDQALQNQLSNFPSTSDAAKGAGLVGFNPSLNYVAQTIGAQAVDDGVNLMWFVSTEGERQAIKAGTSVTDHTGLIQGVLDLFKNVRIPGGIFNFSTLTLKRNMILQGLSPRASILKHTGAAEAIVLSDASSTNPDGRGVYIDDGWVGLFNFELMVNGTKGVECGKTRSSFLRTNGLYMRHRKDLDGGDPNNQFFAGSIGISCDNSPWISSYSTYLTDIQNTFIRGFETGVSLKAIVNSWKFRNVYMIECKKQYVLDGATGITIDSCYHESGVAAARGIVFAAGGGNNIAIRGSSFELTNAAGTQYAYDFTAAGVWDQILSTGVKYLIQGDGNGVNNRRIIGTAPVGFMEHDRSYTSGQYNTIAMEWAPGGNTAKPRNLPSFSRLGGFQQGLGTLYLGRNDTDAADSVVTQDASGNLIAQAYNDVRVQTGANYANLTFTGAPAQGSTSATLNAAWANPTGAYNVLFSNGDVRSVTLTNAATTATWATGLSAAATTAGTAFGLFTQPGWKLDAGGRWWGPQTDNSYSLGAASNRPSQLYAATATINTSDERSKQDIEYVPVEWLQAWGDVKWQRFRFRDAVQSKGDGARWHIGLIAQRVRDVFAAHGLDAHQIGLLCYDEWPAKPEVLDADGNIIEPAQPAGNRFGVRYEEALAMECAFLRWKAGL